VAASASADPVVYTFDVTAGEMTWAIQGMGITTSGMTGTFSVTIYQSDGHIGESDTFVLGGAWLANTDAMQLGTPGTLAANVGPGSARLLDFMPDGPDHIGPGGAATVDTDIAFEATVLVTGLYDTTYATSTSAGMLLPVDLTFSTSAAGSDVVTASLRLGDDYGFIIGIPELSMTITLDLMIDVVGTAHVVPDPAIGGMSALGLAGACAWLRRRRG